MARAVRRARVSQKVASGGFEKRGSGLVMESYLLSLIYEALNKIAPSALLPRNDGMLNGILNEIASSFVSLTSRNDGILKEIHGSCRGMTQGLGNSKFSLEF